MWASLTLLPDASFAECPAYFGADLHIPVEFDGLDVEDAQVNSLSHPRENHRITQCSGLEGTSKSCQVQPSLQSAS